MPGPSSVSDLDEHVDVGRVADLLGAAGVTVDVDGPHGPVAVVGAGAAGRLGRALTGSRRVTVVPRGAVRLAWSSAPIRARAVGVSVVLVALAAIRAAVPTTGPTAPSRPTPR